MNRNRLKSHATSSHANEAGSATSAGSLPSNTTDKNIAMPSVKLLRLESVSAISINDSSSTESIPRSDEKLVDGSSSEHQSASDAACQSTKQVPSDVCSDSNDEAVLVGFCQICGKDLQHVNSQRQQQHINRCLDVSESSVTRRDQQTVPECPICGQKLKTENLRRTHIKKCAAKFNISTAELLQIVRDQALEASRNTANPGVMPSATDTPLLTIDIPAVDTAQPAQQPVPPARLLRKRTRRPRFQEPRSKLDEDTQLAIALSVSTSEVNRKSLGDFVARPATSNHGQSADSIPSLQPADAGGADGATKDAHAILMAAKPAAVPVRKRKSRKKEQTPREPPPLLATDQDTLRRKLEAKVSEILCSAERNVSGRGSVNGTVTGALPKSRLSSKYETRWDKDTGSSIDTVKNVLWSESALPDSMQTKDFYVAALGPYVTVSSRTMAPAAAALTTMAASNQLRVNQTFKADVTAANTTLYGSTQMVADLAELAAEAGNQTLSFIDLSLASRDHAEVRVVEKPESSAVADRNTVISDGFCLGSSEVSELARTDLLQSLEQLVNSSQLSDMTLKLSQGHLVPVHRLLLAVRCPTLIELADAHGTMELENASLPETLTVLRYLYAGNVNVPHDVVFETRQLAERLKLDALGRACNEIIEHDDLQPPPVNASPVVTATVDHVCFAEDTASDNESLEFTDDDEREESQAEVEVESDENDDLGEVYEFMATQRVKAKSSPKKSLGTLQLEMVAETKKTAKNSDGSESDNSDVEFSSDDGLNASLTQALLLKLEQSFLTPKVNTKNGNTSDVEEVVLKSGNISSEENGINRSDDTTEETVADSPVATTSRFGAEVWHFSPVSDIADEADLLPKDVVQAAVDACGITSNMEVNDLMPADDDDDCCMIVEEYENLVANNDDPCAGCYDRVTPPSTLPTAADPDVKSSYAYSAASPPSLFEEDSVHGNLNDDDDEHQSERPDSPIHCTPKLSRSYITESDLPTGSSANASPAPKEDDTRSFQTFNNCASPEDLFGSPESQPATPCCPSFRKEVADNLASDSNLPSNCSSPTCEKSPEIPVVIEKTTSAEGDEAVESILIPSSPSECSSDELKVNFTSLRKVRAKTRNSLNDRTGNSSSSSRGDGKRSSSLPVCRRTRQHGSAETFSDVEPDDDDVDFGADTDKDFDNNVPQNLKDLMNSSCGRCVKDCSVHLERIDGDHVSLQVDGSSNSIDGDALDEVKNLEDGDHVDHRENDRNDKSDTSDMVESPAAQDPVIDDVWDGFTEGDGAAYCMQEFYSPAPRIASNVFTPAAVSSDKCPDMSRHFLPQHNSTTSLSPDAVNCRSSPTGYFPSSFGLTDTNTGKLQEGFPPYSRCYSISPDSSPATKWSRSSHRFPKFDAKHLPLSPCSVDQNPRRPTPLSSPDSATSSQPPGSSMAFRPPPGSSTTFNPPPSSFSAAFRPPPGSIPTKFNSTAGSSMTFNPPPGSSTTFNPPPGSYSTTFNPPPGSFSAAFRPPPGSIPTKFNSTPGSSMTFNPPPGSSTTFNPPPGFFSTTFNQPPGSFSTTFNPPPGSSTTFNPPPGSFSTTFNPPPGSFSTTFNPPPGSFSTTFNPPPGSSMTFNPPPGSLSAFSPSPGSFSTTFSPPPAYFSPPQFVFTPPSAMARGPPTFRNSPSSAISFPKSSRVELTPASSTAVAGAWYCSPLTPTDVETDVSAVMNQIANTSEMWRSDVSFGETPGPGSSVAAPTLQTPVALPKAKLRRMKSARRYKGSRIRYKGSNTPMPVYDEMVTPALKAQCGRFGVRALPKKKMVKVLETIYYGTHPAVQPPQLDERDKAPKKRPKKPSNPATGSNEAAARAAAATKARLDLLDETLASVAAGAQQPDSGQRTKGTRVRMNAKGANSNEFKTPAAKRGQGSSRGRGGVANRRLLARCRQISVNLNDSFSTDDCESANDSDRFDVPEESLILSSPEKGGAKVYDLMTNKEKLWDYITTNEDLYNQILQYKPLELDEFVEQLKEAGITLSSKNVVKFLDDQNILFSMRKCKGVGWAGSRVGKTKRRRKRIREQKAQALASQATDRRRARGRIGNKSTK